MAPGSATELVFSRTLCDSPRAWREACERLNDTTVGRVHTSDSAGTDAFVDAGIAATILTRAAVGVSVALPTRSAVQTAWASMTLAGMAAQPPTVCFGAGSQRVIEGVHGMPWQTPVTRLGDYVTTIEDLVRSGADGLSPDRLELGIGGHGPRMVDLAGRLGSALTMHIFTPAATLQDRLSAMSGSLRRVDLGLVCAVHEDEAAAMRLARLELASFLSVGTFLQRLAEVGGEGRAQVFRQLADEDLSTAAKSLEEETVRRFILVTTPERIREQASAWADVDGIVPVPIGLFGGAHGTGLITADEAGRVRQHLSDSFFGQGATR